MCTSSFLRAPPALVGGTSATTVAARNAAPYGELVAALGLPAVLVQEGGYGLFSVPLSYPYHPDPIDTKLRPTAKELAAMMPDWAVVRSAEIEAGNYWQDLQKGASPMSTLIRQIARVAMPFYRPGKWRENASRLSWLFRSYRLSLVLLKKPAL